MTFTHSSSTNENKLQVFLCHASADKPKIIELYKHLAKIGWIKPWLDKKDLIPGQNWEVEISKVVRQSQVVLVCLSPNSVNKADYVQK